jgi:hypothetical protein
MERKLISLTDQAQIVVYDPEDLSNYLVEALVDLVQRAKNQDQANKKSVATYWFNRVPFDGVQYYSSG